MSFGFYEGSTETITITITIQQYVVKDYKGIQSRYSRVKEDPESACYIGVGMLACLGGGGGGGTAAEGSSVIKSLYTLHKCIYLVKLGGGGGGGGGARAPGAPTVPTPMCYYY